MLIAGSIYLVVSRRDMLRSEHRLDSLLSRESIFLANNLVLVGLCFVIFWGTYFPLISEALTGQEASVGPPWFDRYTVPLALVLVLLSGIGPVIAWRRATLANARRNFLVPVAGRARDAGRAARAPASRSKPLAIAMFCCARVRVRQHRAGVLPRRARAARDGGRAGAARAAGARAPQPQALRRLHRAHRHRGAVHRRGRLLVLPARLRARASRRASRRASGAYTVRYVRPTATITPKYDAAHTGSTLSLGAVLDVTKRGRHVATLNPSEGYYASQEASQGTVGQPDRRPAGQPREHGRRHHARRVERDRARHRSARAAADHQGRATARCRPKTAIVAIGYLARAYLQHPPPAQFHFIVSPLVMWIWIGGLIVFGGGLIAIWPAPSTRAPARRRARARARAARGLARA